MHSLRWVGVRYNGLGEVDRAVRQRIASRQAAANAAATAAANSAATTGGAAPAAPASTAGAGEATASSSSAASSSSGSAAAASGNPAAASRTPATLPPPPSPVPYNQAEVRRYEQQVQTEFRRIQNETDERIRRNEEMRRRQQQNMDRAVEAGMAPLMAYLEAKERERKAAEVRREYRRLQGFLDQVNADVRASVEELNKDEAALMRVIAKHPGLPSNVRSVLDSDINRIREIRNLKFELVEEYSNDLLALAAEAREEHNGDITATYRNSFTLFPETNAGRIRGIHEMSTRAIEELARTTLPAGRKMMIAQDLGPALVENHLRLCRAGTARVTVDTYVKLGGRDARLLEIGNEAEALERYESAVSTARSRLQRAVDEFPTRFAPLVIVPRGGNSALTYFEILSRMGTGGLSADERRVANQVERQRQRDRSLDEVRLRGVTGLVDARVELAAQLDSLDLTPPSRRHFPCVELADPKEMVNRVFANTTPYIRTGPQQITFSKLYHDPAQLVLTRQVRAGEPLRLEMQAIEREFTLDAHLAVQGEFLDDSRFALKEKMFRNLQLTMRSGGLLDLELNLGSTRVIRATRYLDRRVTPYYGFDWFKGGGGIGGPNQLVRAFGNEYSVQEQYLWGQMSMVNGALGLAKRLGQRTNAMLELSAPLYSAHGVRYSRTIGGENGDLTEEDVMTFFGFLNPTVSLDVTRFLPRGRIGLRLASTLWWAVAPQAADDDNEGSYARTRTENFLTDRLAHTIALTFRF